MPFAFGTKFAYLLNSVRKAKFLVHPMRNITECRYKNLVGR
jgi:hypothetical protein